MVEQERLSVGKGLVAGIHVVGDGLGILHHAGELLKEGDAVGIRDVVDVGVVHGEVRTVVAVDGLDLCFTMKGFLYFSDGTDYTDRVIEKLDNIRPYDGEHARRFNEQLGLECRDKAIEELRRSPHRRSRRWSGPGSSPHRRSPRPSRCR